MANSAVREGYSIAQFNIHLCSQSQTLSGAEFLEPGDEELFYYTRIDKAPTENCPEPWFVLLACPYPVELADAKNILDEFEKRYGVKKE